MQSLIQSGLISLAAMADSDENEAAAATSELVMLDAMYPGALSLDPPGWHEAERPELPVSGTLQCAELSGQPHLTVHFDLHYGYPLHTAFRVHVSCAEAGRDAGAILASWGAEQVEQLADSVAPLTEFVQALNEMPPLRNAPTLLLLKAVRLVAMLLLLLQQIAALLSLRPHCLVDILGLLRIGLTGNGSLSYRSPP